ncbi:MAG: hypothetical protein Q7S57_06245 [bacterium]|nr:hypothetical protein [bacterium]
MSKRNLIIIAIVFALLVFGIVGYFLFGKKTGVGPSPEPTATPTESPIFTATPTPDGPLVAAICPTQWIGQTDTDNDGLPDTVEAIYKTDTNNPDTDGDSYKDGEEVKNGYDPLKPGSARLDSDNDGLTDDQECKWETDAFKADSDGDSFNDGAEVINGYDPLIPGNARIGGTSPTPIPGFSPSPEPTGIVFGTPTPTTSTLPTATPRATVAPTFPPVNFVKVARTELNISKNSTPANVKTYLATVDQSSPAVLIGGTPFTDALVAAFNGDGSKLQPVLAQLNTYEKDILKISTPENAINHQILLVSLARSVNQQLGIIASVAGKDPQKQLQAATGLQKILSDNLNALKIERQKLDALAK